MYFIILVRPLVFKPGPDTCKLVVRNKIYFPIDSISQTGRGNKTYNSGGSNINTSEGYRVQYRATQGLRPSRPPHLVGSGGGIPTFERLLVKDLLI